MIRNMKKRMVFIALFVITGGLTFAEGAPGGGTLKSTFGLGFAVLSQSYNSYYSYSSYSVSESLSLTAVSFDTDYIAANGFTVTFGDLVGFKIGTGITQILYFGFGYHYVAKAWDAGACLVVSALADDGLISVKGDLSHWFTDSMGITGGLILGGAVMNRASLFSGQLGASVRLGG
jgi:hypothetical protein